MDLINNCLYAVSSLLTRNTRKIGLEINPTKCELFFCGDTDQSIVDQFNTVSPGIKVVDINNLELLGAPITEEAEEKVLIKMHNKMKIMFERIGTLNHHVAYYLLKNCFSIPKLTYLLRSTSYFKHKHLLNAIDNDIKTTLETICNSKFKCDKWEIISLPARCGGLGIRQSTEICLPSFLSSIHSVINLVTLIDPELSAETMVADYTSAMEDWFTRFNSIPDNMSSQSSWDNVGISDKVANLNLNSEKDKARYLASTTAESNLWLAALPSKHLGTLLDNNAFRISIALRFGLDICSRHNCRCGDTVFKDGLHGLSCIYSAGRLPCHSELNNIIHQSLQSSQIPARREPEGMFRDDGKRVDGVTLIPWSKGQNLVWDATCSDTMAPSYLELSCNEPGKVATKAANVKLSKYKKLLDQNYIILPFAVETLGQWCDEAIKFIDTLGNLIKERTCETRAKMYLKQRIGMAIQRTNAARVMGTFGDNLINNGAKLLLCGCILFERGSDNNNTEGLRSALARLRHRTGPSLPNPSNTNSPQGTVISDIRTYHLSDKSISPLPTPAPPSTPRKTKVSTHNAMTVSVTHAQVSIATATSSVTNPAVVAMAMIRPTSPGNSSSSDTENVAHSSSTALRRLYFKSARSSRAKGRTVPKVVVMGSSTTSNSEATINTSTESASTLVTNVTATDTSETCDSLDLGDTSGQSEPLLSSFDEPATAISINLRQTGNLTEDEDHNLITPGADTPLLINYEKRDSKNRKAPQAPRTAPITSTTHFPFDTPASPKSVRSFEKNQSQFAFANDSCPYQPTAKTVDSPDVAPSTTGQRGGTHVFKNGGGGSSGRDEEKENENKRWEHSNFLSRKFNDVDETDVDDCKMEKKDISLKSRNRFLNSIKNLSNKEKYGSNSKINSAPAVGLARRDSKSMPDTTMFPFDREAIDYERIQRECFADEDDTDGFPHCFDTDDSVIESPTSYEKPYFDSPSKSYQKIKMYKYSRYPSNSDIFHQYNMIAQQETMLSHEQDSRKPNKFNKFDKRKSDAFMPRPNNESLTKSVSKFDQIASKFEQIPPKPLDAFHHHTTVQPELHHTALNASTSSGGNSQQSTSSSSSSASSSFIDTTVPNLRIDYFAESKKQTDNTLDDGQKLAHNSPGAINVTPNPMDAPVCTQPRATIVVQQASLSLDNTVETFLLKNEGDFVSVEQHKELTRKQRREENMRQLLDVTNTLTTEEIRDFEMRYGSPHHCRSQSVKTPGSRASGRPNQLCLPQQRSRVASMPNTGVEEEYYRLRHFSITGKGVVNRGDSLKSKRSRSNNSVASSNSSTEHLTATNIVTSARTSATCSIASSRESSTSNPGHNGPFKVLMLGEGAVGKSSIVSQFMTSEYLHAFDSSVDEESGEKNISVLLSGEESEMIFIDHSAADMSPENCLSSYNPHGYCVVYSSADRNSFVTAERICQALWTSENIAQRAVILVGNKADLARSRSISSEEGKAMATAYDCKFIETSVHINHNVDELLVGILSQIRLKLENPEKSRDLFRKRSYRKSKRRACSPLGSACLSGNGGTNPSTPVSATANNLVCNELNTPPSSAQSSPRKYRGSRTSASLKVKGLLGRVWARDSKSKSCENLHVL